MDYNLTGGVSDRLATHFTLNPSATFTTASAYLAELRGEWPGPTRSPSPPPLTPRTPPAPPMATATEERSANIRFDLHRTRNDQRVALARSRSVSRPLWPGPQDGVELLVLALHAAPSYTESHTSIMIQPWKDGYDDD